MADLGCQLPLPLGSDLGGGVDLLLGVGGLRRLAQLLGDAGQRGLLAYEQGRLKFLPQQEVVFGLLHLRRKVSRYYNHQQSPSYFLLRKPIDLSNSDSEEMF